jgi:hypothetical protein
MRYTILFSISLLLAACSLNTNPPAQVEPLVNATPLIVPVNPPPLPSTPLPTPTPFDLKGLFCEYQFCIGHPLDMAYFDVNASKNTASPSTYSQGMIATFNGNLFMQTMWQLAPGSADPQFMLDLITDDVDTRVGTFSVQLIRDMNVIYTPITSTATPLLPHGAAAAWICGERAFAWKVYSPQAESAQALFDQAFERFHCNR